MTEPPLQIADLSKALTDARLGSRQHLDEILPKFVAAPHNTTFWAGAEEVLADVLTYLNNTMDVSAKLFDNSDMTEVVRTVAKSEDPKVRTHVAVPLCRVAVREALLGTAVELLVDEDLSVHCAAARLLFPKNIETKTKMYSYTQFLLLDAPSSGVVDRIASVVTTPSEVSLRVIETLARALGPDTTNVFPTCIAEGLVAAMTCDDVLLELNAVEVFCNIIDNSDVCIIPIASFAQLPQFPRAIEALLSPADGSATVRCFAFHFLARLVKADTTSSLIFTQHPQWLTAALDAADCDDDRLVPVACAALSVLTAMSATRVGAEMLLSPQYKTVLQNIFRRELCDARRTAQGVTPLTTCAYDAFATMIICCSNSLYSALAVRDAVEVGVVRRNPETRFAFLQFVKVLCREERYATSLVDGSPALVSYLCNLEGEGDTQCANVRIEIVEILCEVLLPQSGDSGGAHVWRGVLQLLRSAQNAPKVAMVPADE
eukprot:PhM_4_TR16376/c0_g1_i1/m.77396